MTRTVSNAVTLPSRDLARARIDTLCAVIGAFPST